MLGQSDAAMILKNGITAPAPVSPEVILKDVSSNLESYNLGTGVGANITDNATTTTVYADLTNATSATINQLRLAFATQKFLEIQARGGSRYIEALFKLRCTRPMPVNSIPGGTHF